MANNSKRQSNKSTTIGKSATYKYVTLIQVNCKVLWRAHVVINSKENKSFSKTFSNDEAGERAAALWADKKLLEYGKKPVNILKPKK